MKTNKDETTITISWVTNEFVWKKWMFLKTRKKTNENL